MKLTSIFALLATTSTLAACGGESSQKPTGQIVTENDFESTAGWGVDPASLSKEKAHSGSYSISVDPAHEFSLTYENALGQLSPQKFKKLHVSAWVYLLSPKGNGVLGIQLMDPAQGKAIGGEGINLGETVKKYNEWVQVSKDMLIPDNVTSTTRLKVFLWRGTASQALFADDISISIPE
jgi:hypothetical protein